MLIGYARVSTHDQQRDALEKAGCTKIFTEAEICRTFKISRTTLFQYVNKGNSSRKSASEMKTAV
jgi:DNA invertase Pin-like site-specific DNA recombinase